MIVSAPAWAFASWIAARRVQVLTAVTHLPSPGAASTASVVSLTVNVAAAAGATASNSAATPRRKRLTGAMEGEAKTNARYAGGCQDCPRGGGLPATAPSFPGSHISRCTGHLMVVGTGIGDTRRRS